MKNSLRASLEAQIGPESKNATKIFKLFSSNILRLLIERVAGFGCGPADGWPFNNVVAVVVVVVVAAVVVVVFLRSKFPHFCHRYFFVSLSPIILMQQNLIASDFKLTRIFLKTFCKNQKNQQTRKLISAAFFCPLWQLFAEKIFRFFGISRYSVQKPKPVL